MTNCADHVHRLRAGGVSARHVRRGFTLIELVLAATLGAVVLAAVTFSLSQLGRARTLARDRVQAHQRASMALESVRTEVASLIRSDDLFDCRFLLESPTIARGRYDRSELLLFSNSMRPVRDIDYQGEGLEYETAFRLEDDDLGTALWRRRDPVPDEVPNGGGIAEPLVDGVVGLLIEASDGKGTWSREWDSDYDGIPKLVRITVTTTGAELGAAATDRTPEVTMQTVVAIPRLIPPKQEPTKEELAAEAAEAAAAVEAANAAAASGGRPGGGAVISTPGGGIDGGGAIGGGGPPRSNPRGGGTDGPRGGGGGGRGGGGGGGGTGRGGMAR